MTEIIVANMWVALFGIMFMAVVIWTVRKW
jgi:hypothetical protein